MYGSQSKDPSLFRDDAAAIKGVYITCMYTGGVCTRVCVCLCVLYCYGLFYSRSLLWKTVLLLLNMCDCSS